MHNLKRVVRYLMRMFRNKFLPPRTMVTENRFAVLKRKIRVDSPVIVDGGAHTGDVIDIFLQHYRSPIIYAFEPIPELAQRLRRKYAAKKGVVVHEKALGAETRTIEFNIVNATASSSVLTPTALHHEFHGTGMAIRKTVSVQQSRLDEVLDQDIDILKLDLQGYELEALKGCGKLLGRTKAILTEVEFVPLYEGQPLFSDVDIFLREAGFQLLNLYEIYSHSSGQLSSADAIYLNARL